MFFVILKQVLYDNIRANVSEQKDIQDLPTILDDLRYIMAIAQGLSIPEENIIVIDANVNCDELEDIWDEKLLPIISLFMKKEDVFVFSFNSGHGVEIDGGQHLVTNSAAPNAFHIEAKLANMALSSRGRCRVIAVYDCCRSKGAKGIKRSVSGVF